MKSNSAESADSCRTLINAFEYKKSTLQDVLFALCQDINLSFDIEGKVLCCRQRKLRYHGARTDLQDKDDKKDHGFRINIYFKRRIMKITGKTFYNYKVSPSVTH